jgi:hypothetical protein
MHSPELRAVLRSQQQVLTILWAALIASAAIYVVVSFLVAPAEVPEAPQELVIVLGIVAVAVAIASMVMPRKLLPDNAVRGRMQAKRPAAVGAHKRLSEREQRLASVAGLYMAPWLVGMVLAEAVAIFGLVLVFITGDPNMVIPFAVVGAALMLLKRPNVSAFVEHAEKLSV